MYIERFLKKNQTVSEVINGKYIYLDTGKRVQVVTKPQGISVTIKRGDQFEMPEDFEEIQLTNLGDSGEIVLVCSPVKFIPSLDDSSLKIKADFEADNLQVSFTDEQPVKLPSDQHVNVSIDNHKEVQKVHIENHAQPVDVQKVHVVKETQPDTSFIAHESMVETGVISGNVNRQMIILKADDGNTDTIWLGGFEGRGFPLPPQSAIMWGVTAEISALIPTGNKLLVSEVA